MDTAGRTSDFWAIIGVGVALLAFLWSIYNCVATLHNVIADLRERVARLEGLMKAHLTRPHPHHNTTKTFSHLKNPSMKREKMAYRRKLC